MNCHINMLNKEHMFTISTDNGSMVREDWSSRDSVDSVVSHRCGVDGMMSDRSGVDERGVVRDRGGFVGRLRVGLALIPHVSDEAVVVVGVVGDDLDTAVGELHPVLSLDHSVLVLGLGLGEVSSVRISSSVLVSEWLWWEFFLVIRSRCWVVRSRGRSISRSNWDHCSQGG